MFLSFTLFSSAFRGFFFNFAFFSYFMSFLFSIFIPLFHFSFFRLIKIANIYRFLLTNICFFPYRFKFSRVFPHGGFQLFSVLVGFEHNVKVTFKVETSLSVEQYISGNTFEYTYWKMFL